MSLYGDDYLTDPGYKAYVRGVGGGGRGPTGGGTGGVGGLAGGGAGGLLGGLNTTTGGNESALKQLLRKRMRMPGAPTGPSYAAPADPVAANDGGGSSLDALLGAGGSSRFGVDFGGTGMTMGTYGRAGMRTPTPMPSMPSTGSVGPAGGGGKSWRAGGGAGSGGGTAGGGKDGPDRSAPEVDVLDIIKQFADAGFFSPEPNQALMDSVRSRATGDAQALLQRNRLTAQSMGTDPATAASYALQSDLKGQGSVSDAVNASSLQQLLSKQNFSQDLLKQYLAGLYGNQSSGSSGTDWGGILSGIGSIIGLF